MDSSLYLLLMMLATIMILPTQIMRFNVLETIVSVVGLGMALLLCFIL